MDDKQLPPLTGESFQNLLGFVKLLMKIDERLREEGNESRNTSTRLQ
jgi:hypothetical protein